MSITSIRMATKRVILFISSFVLYMMMTTLSYAHEAWIEPRQFQLSKKSQIKADIRVGQLLRGNASVFNPDTQARLELHQGETQRKVKGRLGDLPAIKIQPKQAGLTILAYQSYGRRLNYETAEKFTKFANKEGVPWIVKEHQDRGYPADGFSESFFRYAKSLVAVGDAEGTDKRLGLKIEFVLLTNPYIGNPKEIEVMLYWQNEPYANAQISVFRQAPEASTIRETILTDKYGRAVVPAHPGQKFLLSAINMIPQKAKKNGPLWHSHWASLTYRMPD